MKKYKEDDTLIEYTSQNIFLNVTEFLMIEYLQENYVRVYDFSNGSKSTTKIAKKVTGIKSDVVIINKRVFSIPKPIYWVKHKNILRKLG